MKTSILALATILTLSSTAHAQYYPGPPMYPRDPCVYQDSPECEASQEHIPLPRPRPEFGPPMPGCIMTGECARPREWRPIPMPPFPDGHPRDYDDDWGY